MISLARWTWSHSQVEAWLGVQVVSQRDSSEPIEESSLRVAQLARQHQQQQQQLQVERENQAGGQPTCLRSAAVQDHCNVRCLRLRQLIGCSLTR